MLTDRLVGSETAHDSAHWIPLGSAQIIDWAHLGDSAGARGATAWLSTIAQGPVLLRSWCSDDTIFYEFHCLAGNLPRGSIVLSSTLGEDRRARLKITLEVEGRLAYTDITEFVPHVTTGLVLLETREVEVTLGNIDVRALPQPSGDQAKLFAQCPEEVLTTSCGTLIHTIIDFVTQDHPLPLTGYIDAQASASISESASASRSASSMNDRPVSQADVGRPRAEANPSPRPVPTPTPTPSPAAPATPAGGASPSAGAKQRPSLSSAPRARPLPGGGRPIDPPRAAAGSTPSVDRGPSAAEPRTGPNDVPDRPQLTCSANTGEVWTITDEETFIGRSKQCGIILRSQRVSRKHASLTSEPEGYYINDLGAANGVWCGTEKIERALLQDGSEYIVGDVLLTFHLGT